MPPDSAPLRACVLCSVGLVAPPANVCARCAAGLFEIVERSPVELVPLDDPPADKSDRIGSP